MAHQLGTLAAKSDNSTSVPRTHMVKTDSHQLNADEMCIALSPHKIDTSILKQY